MASSSNRVGPEILKMLGVDPEHCCQATIIMQAGLPIKVNATYNGEFNSETQEFEKIFKKYQMVEIE